MLKMEYSKSGLTMTKGFEGVKLVAYQDQGGVWTIAYGHTRGVYKGQTCTQAEADQWLLDDMAIAVHYVNFHVTLPEITQGEFDALVDFAFNCGCKNLDSSTLLRMVNAGNMTGAAHEFEKWDHVGGQVVAGLLRRRIAEENEFLLDVRN